MFLPDSDACWGCHAAKICYCHSELYPHSRKLTLAMAALWSSCSISATTLAPLYRRLRAAESIIAQDYLFSWRDCIETGGSLSPSARFTACRGLCSNSADEHPDTPPCRDRYIQRERRLSASGLQAVSQRGLPGAEQNRNSHARW